MSDNIFDYCDSCGGPMREETLLDQDRADQARKAAKAKGTDHDRGCAGRCYTCTCGYDDEVEAKVSVMARELAEAREWKRRVKDFLQVVERNLCDQEALRQCIGTFLERKP